ncbi:Hypothetical predicted protein [Paramuricea clavata]|uniref:Uncharacterized protein n=1 Tax=Paramuricea clavata TaxID=317549 RepID=A0A7D9EPG9_PARCT|nr:Hypothetical predicted protein [Paramuricea clavata]
MSLAPKVDEIRTVALTLFVETDGGVCCCVNDSIPYEVLSQYHHDNFEVLWIKARPFRLPRGFSSIIGIVYHPPSSNAPAMNEYLSCQLSAFESSFPNTGTVLLGDFNKLNVSGFSRHFRLKQLVKFPTRGNNTLDLILTDLKEYYSTPEKLSSFGLSDHLTIERLRYPGFCVRTSVKQDDTTRTRTPKPGYFTFEWKIERFLALCNERFKTGCYPSWLVRTRFHTFQRKQNVHTGTNNSFEGTESCSIAWPQVSNFAYNSRFLRSTSCFRFKQGVKSLCGMDPTSPSNDLRLLMSNDNESTGFSHEQLKELAERINQAFLSPMASFTTLPSP